MSKECPIPSGFTEDPFTMNTFRTVRKKLRENTYKTKSKAYLTIGEALVVNDIFYSIKDTEMKYYVVRFKQYTNRDMRLYEIARVDQNPLTQPDLDRLTKNTIIQIKGKFQNKCNNCAQ